MRVANPGGAGIATPVQVAKPESLRPLADFQAWAERYAKANVAEQGRMMGAGLQLAEARRATMAGLIKHDPKAAIEALLPYALRKDLPPEVAQKIEHPIRTRGALNVLAVLPLPGQKVDEPIFRTTKVKEKEYRVYTYGERLKQITTPDTRLLGVGVETADGKRVMALREKPYEVLPKDEAADIKKEQGIAEAVCPVSGEKTEVKGDETAVDTGGEVIWLCSGGHVGEWLHTPDGQRIMYAGGSGNSGGTSPVVPPTHTQGNKKFLALRVRFSNQASDFEPASDATMQNELQTVVNNFGSWSYQKLHSTFAFSPVLTMPQTDAWYAANGTENKLRDDALAAAAAYDDGTGAHPYDPANFDFPCIVYSTGAFGGYCGLATIGGNWNFVKCASANVFEHEWGHNFGLLHANRWEPGTDSPIGPGEHVEYGSPKSCMGSGNFAYNTIERWTINWLAAADVTTVAGGGTYPLYNADKSTLTGGHPYALRIRKDSRMYSVEFRPGIHNDGVLIAWDQSGSQLLDMTPLSNGGQNDAHLLIGRTFSDYAQGLHITPIAKLGTAPDEYIDTVVNYDAGPGNAAPVGVVTASNYAPATGANITLSATASDPDGDALAYFWEFGDGNFSTNNSATQTKNWGTAGKYNVRCTISDRRGKAVAKSVVVTVGAPTNFTISGRVTKADGTGIPDVLMRANGSNSTYTDSDGRYAIARLGAGSHTIVAMCDGWTFSQNFANPVVVGPDAVEKHFTATAVPTYAGVSTEVFTGINGEFVSNLTSAASYPNSPTFRYRFDEDFEAPESFADNYGQRARGFFKAPATGSYFFYIASDDGGELWLGTSENPATRAKIAQVNGWVNSRDWTAQANQKSAAISLTAGQRYYIEALQKEGGGGDHVAVGVDLPGGAQVRPITAAYLDPFSSATPPVPANTVTIAASDAAAAEAGPNPGAFTLTRTGATTAALTVYFDVGGSATYGADFSATGLSATFAAGSATATVNVMTLDDAVAESAETVTLTLSPAPALYMLGATVAATVTIDDNEAAQVTIAATDANADESGSNTGTFTITRTGSTASGLTVNFTTGGNAASGSDYPAIGTSAAIAAGSSAALVTIAPIADGAFEVEETVVLTLAAGAGYTIGAPSSGTVRIAASVGNGGGILREWWDGISNTNFVHDLTNLASYPSSPTGREIVTTEFTTVQDRAENFGERWRAIYTAPVSGNYFFYIASDDYSELWLSTDATPERRQKIASVSGSTGFQNWTQFGSQKSAAIALTGGQRYYIEAIFKEGVGGDHMSVGVEYPNGALERPIPAHRLDPFTATTALPVAWTSQDVGTTGAPGSAGLDSAILSAAPRHRYSFSGTASAAIANGASITDSIAAANAVLRGAGATFNGGGSGIDLPGGGSDTQAYIDLPNGVITGTIGGGTRYTSATYETWLTIQTAQNWSRVFDFGTNSAGEITAPGGTFSAGGSIQNLLLSANMGTALDQRLARSGNTINASRDAAGTMVLGTQVHIALVYDAADQNWRWYRNGVLVQVLPDTEGLATFTDVNNWLGRSNYSQDANIDANYNEFRIYNYALSEAQIRGNTAAGPDLINTLNSGNTGPYLVAGSGVLSTNGATDGFHLDSQSLSGDWEVRVRLVSLMNDSASAVAGLMMREGTAANARHAFIGLTPGGTGRFINRITAGGNAATSDLGGFALPQWLRLVRSGNTIAGFVSTDGAAWTQIGATATFDGLASSLRVGFAVASGTTANLSALAQFDNLTLSPLPGGGDGFLYERFEGISGATIATLTSAASYPNSPTVRETRSGFLETATTNPNIDNFGQRMRGIFIPPLTGSYTFYIAADDTAELWLSTNETAAARVKIANVPSHSNGFRNWTWHASSKSAAIALTAGQRYYIEVLHKEATGPDYMSVGMTLPDGSAEFPMLASRIETYALPASLSGVWAGADVGAPGTAGSSGVLAPGYTGAGDALPLGPRHRYSFSGTANGAAANGATLADSVAGAHGAVRGAGAVFDAIGAGLGLPGGSSGTQAYVDLPNGVATGTVNGGTRYTSASYELWYTQRTNRTWSRVMDIGTNSVGEITAPGSSFTGTNFFMLSGNINSATDQRFDRSGSAGTTQGGQRDALGATQLNQLAHVVVVYDAAVASWRWYRNGILMATLPDTVGLSGLDDVNVWLGRSNYSQDQNLDGILHEFRIYNYALTPAQIVGDFTTGPDVVNTTDIALPRAPRHRWSLAGAPGAAPDGTWLYDSLGGANALVRGAGASFDANGAGVTLPGGSAATQAYIDLPNGVASGTYNGGTRFTNVTYELWATQTTNQSWSRLFDFGTGTAGELPGPGGSASGTNYVHLAANNVLTQNPRLRRKPVTGDAQANVTGATVLNQLTHHVATYDATAQQWRWYRNGVLLATLADTDGVATLADVNNFLGRSQTTTEANWAGTFHEFRIYDYALTTGQVLSNLDAGPGALNVAAPGLAGSVIVSGAGTISTNGASDSFQFASQLMDGDGEFIARLVSKSGNAPCGIMLRESSAAGARHAFIGLANGVVGNVISRAITNGNSTTNPITSTNMPIWYRIVRKGNVVTSFWSFTGASWNQVGNLTLSGLTTNVLVGLAVSSGGATLAEATFDNVQLIRPAVTIAATQNAVEYPPTNGVFTVTRTWDTTTALNVSYTVGGSATAGADYTALSGNVTIPAGQTSATITITPLNDVTSEAPETIAVTLTDVTGYVLGAPPSATLTLAGLETPTEAWQQANFGANWTNDAISGDPADPDNDGLNNLLERALNSNPNTAATTPPVQRSVAGGKLTVTFTRVVANTDLTIGVFAADSPEGPWIELARSTGGATTVVLAPGATASESGAGPTRNVEVRDLFLTTDSAHPRRFLKVVVTH